ncbi:MAG: efflux RND transporter periplasmic adaptor subunit [Chlorobium sp.]|uniref:efflux RND transporter periplasmic adaptor subunit n=1 Tax=Chlorobium sp. TaxID=1095 RepID=UPI002F3ECDDF
MTALSKTQRIAAFSLAGAALILFVVFRPSPLHVDSGTVTKGTLQVVLDAEGYSRVRDRFVIGAPVSGRLARVAFREGDSVAKGDTVSELLPAELDAREFRQASARAAAARAAYDEALARERQATIGFEQAGRRSVRYGNLYSEGAVSKESFELARNEADMHLKEAEAARSAASSARFSFEAQQAVIDRQTAGTPVRIVSPVSGTVLRLHEQSERVVPAGAPLFDIGDPSAIEIVIDLLSTDAVRVKPADRVLIEEWGGGKVLEASVKRIEPSGFTKISALGIEEKRVNIIASLSRKESRLGDNFRIQAKIVLDEKSRVLLVPVSSLFRTTAGWKVFIIENGKAAARPVRIGLRSAFYAEVLDGLDEGDRVVVHPTNELRDGMRVTFEN